MSAILVVCSGNVCRSPLAAAILRKHHSLDGVAVQSAGTEAIADQSMCKRAAAMTGFAGVHRARIVTPELIDDADLILVAAYSHRAAIAQLRPLARRKTFTLTEAGPFVRAASSSAAWRPQTRRVSLENDMGLLVRQMNDMRGTGTLAMPKPPFAFFPRRKSGSTSPAEIADGHWGSERAHGKTLQEVAAASQSIASGLADLLNLSQ